MIDNIRDSLSDNFLGILNYLFDRLFYYLDAFMVLIFSGFDKAGKRVIISGDILGSHFEKFGFSNFNNFVYVFVGFIFVTWAIKSGYKILTKIIEIIGNFTPLT